MIEKIWLPQIDRQRCTGCGDCVAACPTNALALVAGLAVLVTPTACNYSGLCEAICPEDAISLPYQVVLDGGS